MNGFFRTSRLLLLVAVASGGAAWAAFDPMTAYREADAVSVRYPDPKISYATPAFAAGKADFTSQSEMMAYLRQLADRAPSMRLDAEARSQQGRELPILLFSRDQQKIGSGVKPVALIIGQQHGNEPAGGEAALALAQRWVRAISAVYWTRSNRNLRAAYQSEQGPMRSMRRLTPRMVLRPRRVVR